MPHNRALESTPRSRPGSTPGCYVYRAPRESCECSCWVWEHDEQEDGNFGLRPFYSIIKTGFSPPDLPAKHDHLHKGNSVGVRTDRKPRANNCIFGGGKRVIQGMVLTPETPCSMNTFLPDVSLDKPAIFRADETGIFRDPSNLNRGSSGGSGGLARWDDAAVTNAAARWFLVL